MKGKKYRKGLHMIKKLRALFGIFGTALFCYFALLFSLSFAHHENIAVSFDPDLVPNPVVIIEKDLPTGRWKVISINPAAITRHNDRQEALIVSILNDKDAIYIQPFLKWTKTGK